MAWIESHQELGRHPKTRRLARLLDVSIPAAVGHLQFLWWWALDYADDGDLERFTTEDIADGMLWEGDADRLVGALTDTGFLDVDRRIHDWDEFAGRLVQRRKANAERMRRERATHVQRTCSARAGATEQNQTEQNQTEPTGGAPAAREAPPPVAPTPIQPIAKPAKDALVVGNPRVQALVDGLRAAEIEYVVTPQDAKALKLSPAVPVDRVVNGIVKIKRGEWGDDYFRDNLSVALVIGRINGLPNGKNGHARAGPVRTSRKADGRDASEFDAFDDTTGDYVRTG